MNDSHAGTAVQPAAWPPVSHEEAASDHEPHVLRQGTDHDDGERDDLSRMVHGFQRWLNRDTRQQEVADKVDSSPSPLDPYLDPWLCYGLDADRRSWAQYGSRCSSLS